MAKIKSIDKVRLETYLDMGGGYVCDFSNRTFENFMLENADIEIYNEKYAINGESKANRLRSFWDIGSNFLVAKLLEEMIEYWKIQQTINLESQIFNYGSPKKFNFDLYTECKKIVIKIKNENPIEDVDDLAPESNKKDFIIIFQSIKDIIEKNQPEQALDRLHTFVVTYFRELCEKHKILFDKNTPLHGLFGGYVKFLKKENKIESEMSERILKSSISLFEAFNFVRNNQSLAHSNKILNHEESVLIFNNIKNIFGFVKNIEQKMSKEKENTQKTELSFDDIPF